MTQPPGTGGTTSAAPGWYADPDGSAAPRYWDGARWTDQYAPLPASESVDRRADIVLAIGGLLVIVGSALPWLGRDGRTFTSWAYPLESMMRGEPTNGPSTGGVLLLVGVVAIFLALLPTLTGRPPRPVFGVFMGSVAFDVSLAAMMAAATIEPSLSLGVGAIVTLGGAILMFVHGWLARARWRSSVRVNAS